MALPVLTKDVHAYGSLILWVAFLMTWNISATKHVGISAFLFIVALYFLCLVSGTACLRMAGLSSSSEYPLPLRLLFGYFFVNTSLFFLSVSSPLGMVGNSVSLLFMVCAYYFFSKRTDKKGISWSCSLPDLLCLVIGFTASTFWCVDALRPIRVNAGLTVFQMWPDSFFHARQISVFANATGMDSISDITMAGSQPHIYHFASYAIPAALSKFTSTPAYETLASFQLPMGVLLCILAAYTFLIPPFGKWPALVGCAALALLPDASQQGFGNQWLSYQWLQPVNLGGFYGVSLMALAWFFMFEGCSNGKILSVLTGYFLALLVVVYKAHIFVANSYLILIYPCIFMANLNLTWRIGGLLVLSAIYFAVVDVSQSYDNIPVLKLSGLSFEPYTRMVVDNFESNLVGSFFLSVLSGKLVLNVHNLFWAIMMLSVCTFGLFIFILIFLIPKLLHCPPRYRLAFPFFVIVIYLVMSTGLEYDSHKIGMPEELLHRPLVWAYFVVSAWTAAAAAYLLINAKQEHQLRALLNKKIVWLSPIFLFIPLLYSHNLQTMPRWGDFAHYPSIPTCLVNSAKYIHDNGFAVDIVQDSKQSSHYDANDFSAMVLTSIAERQAFAINSGGIRDVAGLNDRLKSLESFKQMTSLAEIMAFAGSHKIDWYVLQASDTVAWPTMLQNTTAFQCGDYRVYHFSQSR